MSAPQHVTITRLDNGWLLHYWDRQGPHEVAKEHNLAFPTLVQVMHRIATVYGVDSPPEQPPSKPPVVSHAEAIARMRDNAPLNLNEDDAVDTDPIPGCATGACGGE